MEGVEEVAVPAVSCCFSPGDCRLVKLEVEEGECMHLNCFWASNSGSGSLHQQIVLEAFLSVIQLCQSSSFSPLKGMSPLFPPTPQLWSCLLLVQGVTPV